MFVYPLTLLRSQDFPPGTVGILSFIGAEVAHWRQVVAFSSLFVIPLLAMFLLVRRTIVAQLTAGVFDVNNHAWSLSASSSAPCRTRERQARHTPPKRRS